MKQPKPAIRLLVCGAREFTDAMLLDEVLRAFAAEHQVAVVIEGESPGADALAREWAQRNGVPVERYPADWERYGSEASPIRNTQMLQDGKPDYVIAFPATTLAASPGTLDMVSKGRAAGLPTRVVGEPG